MKPWLHFEGTRTRGIAIVLAVTLVLNWLVAAGKIAVGYLYGNLTVLADGYHSLLDGANNVVALVAICLASLPPDREHPYGHRKYEHVAAMMIGGLVFLLCWETLNSVVDRFRVGWSGAAVLADDTPTDLFAIGVMVATLSINLAVAWYEHREGVRLNSTLLRSDATHTFSDSFVTCMSIFSLLFAHLAWWLDPLMAVGVVVFLFYAGFSIMRDNVATMTDRTRLDPDSIRHIAESVDGVMNAHGIRSHGMENDIHVDMHIVVDALLTAGEVTRIEGRIQERLQHEYPDVTLVSIHHETEDDSLEEAIWKP